ncbi:MAG: sel1 repeat family protein [Leptolyngbya sp.]|nr:sel1 repeat family protein [Candidatus Melainabacteria bacterium]
MKKSMVNARKFLLGAANHEHAEAMYYLGFMQMHGLGAAHDCGSAYMWFCRAAELNCEKAQCSLGLFYAHGICCDLDIELARYWYERASLRGHAGAQFALACVYVSLGQKKNAAVWTSIAANNGVLVAQALLAKIYMNGLGVSRDLSTAMMWCLIVQANVDVDIDSLEIVLKCQSSILRSTSDDVIDLARERASEWFASRHDFASQSRLPS